MPNRYAKLLLPLRSVAALSVIGPAVLLGYAGWVNYRSLEQHRSERIQSALGISQELALKILQTVERAIAESNEVLRSLDDEAIRADEKRLAERHRLIADAVPETEAIWAFDSAGHPLLSSTVFPVPRALSNADRDYFRAQEHRSSGIFIGEVVQARVGPLRFFVISGRRSLRPDGSFNGVIAVTVLPRRIREFYERLASGPSDFFGLVREDGVFLARYPTVPERPERVDERSGFSSAIRSNPAGGVYTSVAQIDGVERQVGYRRLPGYPVYVLAGVETSAIWRELREHMLPHLVFGVPASLAMCALALTALRRTENFHAEVQRREALESALKQSQRLEAVGQLTGGVAHDFNNLLMVVKGNVDRLRRYSAADERQRRSLDAIDSAADRGASLTRQLLSFSRRQMHNPVPIRLRDHIGQLEGMIQASLPANVRFSVEVPADVPPIKVDVAEFDLAVLNIVVNARDAMPGGGALTLSAGDVTLSGTGPDGLRGAFVFLSLSDTGAGISEANLKRVFEPFFTTKEVGKGTGLGLSQVYGFARQSGGSASVVSRPGAGTTVTIYLPAVQRTDINADERTPEPVKASAVHSRGRALLAEDNQQVAEVTRVHLEQLGYDVTQVPDYEQAIGALESSERAFSLVVSDIAMSGSMSGLDVARHVRGHFGPALPVLLMTGFSDLSQTALDEGVPILRKPFDLKELRRAVARAFRAARVLRAGAS